MMTESDGLLIARLTADVARLRDQVAQQQTEIERLRSLNKALAQELERERAQRVVLP